MIRRQLVCWSLDSMFFDYTDVVQPTISGRPEAFSIHLQNQRAETNSPGGRAHYKVCNENTTLV